MRGEVGGGHLASVPRARASRSCRAPKSGARRSPGSRRRSRSPPMVRHHRGRTSRRKWAAPAGRSRGSVPIPREALEATSCQAAQVGGVVAEDVDPPSAPAAACGDGSATWASSETSTWRKPPGPPVADRGGGGLAGIVVEVGQQDPGPSSANRSAMPCRSRGPRRSRSRSVVEPHPDASSQSWCHSCWPRMPRQARADDRGAAKVRHVEVSNPDPPQARFVGRLRRIAWWSQANRSSRARGRSARSRPRRNRRRTGRPPRRAPVRRAVGRPPAA